MKSYLIQILLILTIVLNSKAQELNPSDKYIAPLCYASGKIEKARISPPSDFLLKSGQKSKCNIIVTYEDFPEDAQIAFEYAVKIWESLLESDIPIRVQAKWLDDFETNVIGSCAPKHFYKNFENAPYPDCYYPVAIAEKISNKELNGRYRYDIVAKFNSNINWYFGTDMNTPDDKYDFVTSVLHEMAHGLGMTGFFFTRNNIGIYGYYDYGDITSYDLLVEKGQNNGCRLVDKSLFQNKTEELKKVLESNDLYASSTIATKNNEGQKPQIYAPSSFCRGSSIYHLNDETFQHGNENSLMTHAISMGEAIHNPGEIVCGIMDDIGWKNIFINLEDIADVFNERDTIVFNSSFESDYGIKSGSAKIIYSFDGFFYHSDTLELVDDEKNGNYTSSLIVPRTDSIVYYLQVQDSMNRIKTEPAVSGELKTIHITYPKSVNDNNTEIQEDEVVIYPNPFKNRINIKNIDFDSSSEIKITMSDLTGKIVWQETKSNIQTSELLTIDLLNLTAGVYIVRISNNCSKTIQKILIKA